MKASPKVRKATKRYVKAIDRLTPKLRRPGFGPVHKRARRRLESAIHDYVSVIHHKPAKKKAKRRTKHRRSR